MISAYVVLTTGPFVFLCVFYGPCGNHFYQPFVATLSKHKCASRREYVSWLNLWGYGSCALFFPFIFPGYRLTLEALPERAKKQLTDSLLEAAMDSFLTFIDTSLHFGCSNFGNSTNEELSRKLLSRCRTFFLGLSLVSSQAEKRGSLFLTCGIQDVGCPNILNLKSTFFRKSTKGILQNPRSWTVPDIQKVVSTFWNLLKVDGVSKKWILLP